MERYSDTAIEIINDLHTERLDYESEYIPLIDCANRCAAYEDLGMTPEQLKGLAEAERNGLLLKLPYKIGNRVYIIYYREARFQACCNCKAKDGIDCDCAYCTGLPEDKCCANNRFKYKKVAISSVRFTMELIPEFGKTVFRTREEAEAALQEAAK